jgi:hypothetical protein
MENIMPQDLKEVKIEVIAYSGYKANERPISFLLADQRLEVKEILDRWYGQEHDYFKVVADDGRTYLLKWNRSTGVWFLVMEAGKE